MIRRICAFAVVAIAASALAAVPAMAQEDESSDAPANTVRIQIRKVESGKVEFGLQLDDDREWLPRARLFPYPTANVGQWLFASPYTTSDGTTVRIQARLLANGTLEFGLQLNGDEVWLPRARSFPYDSADVGTWLFSSPFAVADETAAPEGAPRNLRVAAVICDVAGGPHSVRLEWDQPASGGSARTVYEVTRLRAPHRTDNLSITDPGSDALVSETSHVDSDVRTNEFYEWSVRAQNAVGARSVATVQFIYRPSWVRQDNIWGSRQRNDCDETVTALPGASRPGVPQNLRARLDVAGDRIIVTWAPPADDGGDRITSYQTGRSGADASGPSSWGISSLKREPQSTAYRLDGTTAGAFRYWVRAINSAGIGPWTSVEFILVAPGQDGAAPEGAPRNLRVAAVICDVAGGPHSVRLEWDQPASGGSARTVYEVTRLRAPHRTDNLSITDPGSDALVSGTSHVDSDVRTNEFYEWSVRAQNAVVARSVATVQFIYRPSWVRQDNIWGSRQRNDCDETVTALPGASRPGVPQNLRARLDVAGDRIIVTWAPPADDGGDRITSYQTGRSGADASGPAGWTLASVEREPQSAAYRLDGTTAGAFRYWVRAINSAGIGPWTSVEFIL